MFVCFQCDAENGTYETKTRNMMEREREKALYADIPNSTNNLSRGDGGIVCKTIRCHDKECVYQASIDDDDDNQPYTT